MQTQIRCREDGVKYVGDVKDGGDVDNECYVGEVKNEVGSSSWEKPFTQVSERLALQLPQLQTLFERRFS